MELEHRVRYEKKLKMLTSTRSHIDINKAAMKMLSADLKLPFSKAFDSQNSTTTSTRWLEDYLRLEERVKE